MKSVVVLGCTGSIGRQTLDVVRREKGKFRVVGLSAGSNGKRLEELCFEFGCKGTLFSREGIEGIQRLLGEAKADIAVNGIAGAAGLQPSLMAVESGADLALANKETVVMAWGLIKRTADRLSRKILPVDSEHFAIFSLMGKIGRENVDEIVITASGGPFREYSDKQLKSVTASDALKHPTWSMGKKITVDSATLANKGLEVIEAGCLFDFPPEKIKVVVHPQSLIHSLVRTKDGLLYAQISEPDMRRPIWGALTWPETMSNSLEPFDLASCGAMTFFAPRFDSFPMLAMAFECARKGASYPIAFNAANEVAVAAFLQGRITFPAIAYVTQKTLQSDWSARSDTLDEILSADRRARDEAIVHTSVALEGIS